jgi:hypothetical protein
VTDDVAELRAFKRRINLVEYAGSCGYEIDKKESSTSSIVLRRRIDNDKIIVKTDQDGHGVYFSVRNDQDNGTIIDFVKQRKGLNLGEIRKELRPWIGTTGIKKRPLRRNTAKPASMMRDRGAVKALWGKAEDCFLIPCLAARGIKSEVLSSPRFVGKVRMGCAFEPKERQGLIITSNALFPHYDKEGLCGFEVKNNGFTGFAGGGVKALWFSHCFRRDRTIVFCESGIDAISHAILYPNETARYISIAGGLNPDPQPALIKASLEKMPSGSEVVAAFDNDHDGEKFSAVIEELAPSYVTVRRHRPKLKDWNDELMS